MLKKWLIFTLVIICAESAFSFNNKEFDSISKVPPIIDSLLLSDNLKWSVRLVSNFKQHQFRLKNENSTLKYRPNNPFGIGFGFANQKIVVDIIFNIKSGDARTQTEKFAMEGSFSFKKNYIGFFVENVHGYNVTDNFSELENFRKDISLFSVGLSYLRILSKKPFSIQQMKAGYTLHNKSTILFGLGGFVVTNHLNSRRSIVPKYAEPFFNEEAQISKIDFFGGGISIGVFSYIALPSNFFITLNAAPGLGLLHKKVTTESGSYVPSNPLMYRVDGFAALGYNGKRMYAHFNFGTAIYSTSLDFNNNITYGVTKSKFIVGYKLGKR